MLPDLDGCYNLLVAIARQWANDARKSPRELAALADWLAMTPADVAARMNGQTARRPELPPGRRACPVCGYALPAGARPDMIYCGAKCKQANWAKQTKRLNDGRTNGAGK